MWGGRQKARSLQFFGLVAFIVFIAIHLSMVLVALKEAEITSGDFYQLSGSFYYAISKRRRASLGKTLSVYCGSWNHVGLIRRRPAVRDGSNATAFAHGLGRRCCVAIDFGVLPPEINSARMYAGPGSGPLLAAAAAWDALAAELHSTAASYSSVVSGLTVGWRGPSSGMMATAAAPYTAWMSGAAGQAEQTAAQARAAAAAYETAFAATIPPPVIAANRARLMALIATNFFGQNTPAIMAAQAEYLEMWAQDAAAMYGYAGSSAVAARVTPFSPPPQTTNSGGTAAQAAAVTQAASTAAGAQAQALPQAMSATPQALQSLAGPVVAAAPALAAAADPPSLFSALDGFITGPLNPLALFTVPGVPYLLGIQSYLLPQASANLTRASENYSKALAKASTVGLSQGEIAPRVVSAGLGRAGLVGGLSVPQGWASAAPEIKTIASILPQSSLSAAPAALAAEGQSGSLFGPMALSGLAGRAMVGTGGAAARPAAMGGGAAVGEVATTANIFVIPEADFPIPEAGE